MRGEDLTVEVRDRNLLRQGQILTRDLNLEAKLRWSGVGEWKLTLPGDHPMVPALRTPGSGLLVTGRVDPTGTLGPVFSGPTTRPTRVRNLTNPDGTLTFTGVTDEIHLQDSLAYPSPSVADPGLQTAANDVQTGPAETLMRYFVNANVGPGAPSGRRRGQLSKIVLGGADGGLGGTTQKSPRFQNLLELLQELAVEATLGFRLVQEGPNLVFRTVPVRDLRKLIRFDVNNGTLTSEEVAQQGASLTKAIVAGQGEGVDRTIITRTTAESTTDEADWGRAIEVFFDRRDTDELLELQAKGDEELELGRGGTSAKVVPADDATMRYLIDWREGDWVSVVVDGTERPSVVTEAVILVGKERAIAGAALGDVTTFDPRDKQAAKQDQLDSRIGYLERASAGPVAFDRLPVFANPRVLGGGPASERDALFGTPATDPARVALANLRPTWYNTEKGYTEGYFAVTGTSGLMVPGLLAGFPAGWYPLAGSRIAGRRGKVNGTQSVGGAFVECTWGTPTTSDHQYLNGGMTAVGNGLTVPIGGFYLVRGEGYFTGHAAQNYGSIQLRQGSAEITTTRAYFSPADMNVLATGEVPVAATVGLSLWAIVSGGSNLFGTNGRNGSFLEAEYKGPPLGS